MRTSVQVYSPTTDFEWRHAATLVKELIDWDVSQSSGFSRSEVVEAFYPDSMADIQARSTAPHGLFLLATSAKDLAGCAAFKQLSSEVCELYCVYVRPDCRGHGVGALLVDRLKMDALAAGYTTMYLETATFMHDAHRLYQSQRFEIRDHYRSLSARYANAIISMQCDLRSAESPGDA